MSRLSLRTLPFPCALLLLAPGCYLDPKLVGDDGATTDSSSTSDGADSATTGTTDDAIPDDGAGEVFEEWEGVTLERLLRSYGGQVLALAENPLFDGGTIYGFEVSGKLEWSGSSYRYFDDFEVGAGGYLVMSGWQDNGVDPAGAYLWLLQSHDDAEIPMYDVMLAGGASSVVEVDFGGGMLWTVTAEAALPEDPHVGVLRRHGPEGIVELTHPLLAPSSTLAVDVDGYAYTIADGVPPQLHRVAPGGGVVWSLPMEPGVTGLEVLHARIGEPGVVVVSEVAGARHVEEIDGNGVTLHEVLVPAMSSPLPPASDVGGAILLAHPLPPDAYVVEARSADGTLLWSATRSVVGAASVVVSDVLEIPGGAVVIGQAERNGAEFGFIRFVVAP